MKAMLFGSALFSLIGLVFLTMGVVMWSDPSGEVKILASAVILFGTPFLNWGVRGWIDLIRWNRKKLS